MLVDFGARIEHPGAGTKKIFVVALMLELMVHDVKKDYEDFYNLLNVLLFFQLFLLVQFCVFLVHISEPLVLIVPWQPFGVAELQDDSIAQVVIDVVS